ncbi:hypothetical protein [Breznakibacter xylanolyticus]|uniref:hypothetical protein n=1 Tax=Breznakibacter xylanolyticus TaxID=990 RepID=UPI000DAE12B2|nr:hypothetical protein [Breznakibacter xylanolyticus]
MGLPTIGCNGKISRKDEIFEWLSFDINLICPIYLDFEKIILDYENPKQPSIIYPQNGKDISSAYDDLKNGTIIEFEKIKYSLAEFDGLNDENWFEVVGITGNPEFEQDFEIPICPKSNKKMKFLCQFRTFGKIKAQKTIKCEDESMQEYFDFLNFWCDGSLFVFVEPDSKTVCYFIQNT